MNQSHKMLVSVLVLVIFFLHSGECAISYTWEIGYWVGSHSLAQTALEPRLCMPQVAENMIVNREPIDGAAYWTPGQTCYSVIIGSSSYKVTANDWHVEFLLLLALYEVNTIPVAEIFTLYTRVKVPVGETVFRVYSIDSLQHEESMQGSSRMLIQSQKSPTTDTADTAKVTGYTQTLFRHNESRWANAIEDRWTGTTQDTFTTLNINIKMGDTDLEEGHQQWMVALLINTEYTEFLLTAIEVTRPTRECSLVLDASMIFHAEAALAYRNHSWAEEFSMIPQIISNEGNVLAFRIPRLYIDSYVFLEVDYNVSLDNMFTGTKNMTVSFDINWFAHSLGVNISHFKNLLLQNPITREGQSRFWVQQHNNVTVSSFTSDTHDFHCRPQHGSQIAPCYMIEKSSGSIQYMSPFVVKVIGYNKNTSSIYGLTAKGEVVDYNKDINQQEFIISKRKWNDLLNAGEVIPS